MNRLTHVALVAALASSLRLHATIYTDIVAIAAADGSALGAAMVYDSVTGGRTYPTGFNLYDKKGAIVFTNLVPPGITAQGSLMGFNGSVAILRDSSLHLVMPYAAGKNGFTALPTIGGRLVYGWCTSSRIFLVFDPSVKGASPAADKLPSILTVLVYDKGMHKLLYSLISAPNPYWFGGDVFVCRSDWAFSFSKKGVQFAAHTLPGSAKYINYRYACGADGSLAYWTTDGAGTNAPLTYLDKKGNVVAAGVVFPEAGPVWNHHWQLNKGILYVIVPGTSSSIRAYKLGATTSLLGTIPSFGHLQNTGLEGQNVFFTAVTLDPLASVEVYKKDLSKRLWNAPEAPGDTIEYLWKGMFCRKQLNPAFTICEIIGKKGVVATHTFAKP